MKNLLLLLLLMPFASLAQPAPLLPETAAANEQELLMITRNLYQRDNHDTAKMRYNQQLIDKFSEVLSDPRSFGLYHFDSLKKDISILNSPDGRFRIINWNVQKDDGSQEYFGFIQENFRQVIKRGMFHREVNETVQLYPLSDHSAEIRNPENTISDHRKWYGMWYYKIVPKTYKKRTYYTLLAWDGNDKYSQRKIVDVLTFDNAGVPKFGADIFIMPKRYPKRLIFEYSATCTMSLKYNESKDSIIFDHLAPLQSQLEGQYQYYCSDMSYDGLGFRKGKWYYKADVQALNPKDDRDRLYHDPHDRSGTHDQSGIINPADKSLNKDKRKNNLEKEKKKK